MKETTYKMKDASILKGYCWEVPSGTEELAKLLIIHGSIEHARRYNVFASYMAKEGIKVYSYDQRGHGRTAVCPEKVTELSREGDGWENYISDIKEIIEQISRNEDQTSSTSPKPLYLLGHSMGSFEVRDFASRNSELIDALIVIASSTDNLAMNIKLLAAKLLSKLMIKIKGPHYRSKALHKIVYGDLKLSRDPQVEEDYNKDPYCGNICTVDYIYQMTSGAYKLAKTSSYKSTANSLPILLVSGGQDKIGGDKIYTVTDQYKKHGSRDVSTIVYAGAYHEVLNETNKKDVYDDILNWIKEKLYEKKN